MDYGDGKKVITPLAQVYTNYLDSACFDIVTGAFDYNSVLRRVVTQLTNSGLRQIDYSSVRANRVDVAARKAVMTAVANLTHTLYEAKQRQRQMETAMRAQREKVQLLQHGGADPQEVMLMKAKYQGQLNEYAKFSKKMKLEQERERIYLDMRGRIATNSEQQNSMFPPEMIQNASSDIAQYKKYREILGDSIGSLVKFGQLKYNDSEKWEKVQSKFFTYLEIDKKDWSQEFKIKSKQAYDRFREQGEELSVHALSRLPRLNKPGYEVIHEKDVLELVKTKSNYSEGEEKIIWFSPSKQLVVIKNKNSGDIVSIVRRKNKKEGWTDAGF